jgi:hypothetical protein
MNGVKRNFKITIGALSIFAALALAGQPAHALSYPDMKVAGIWVNYDSASNLFSAYGNAEKYLRGLQNEVSLTTYPYVDLFANITGSGTLAAGTNAFAVYDELDDNPGYTAGDYLYLSGKLTSLSYTQGAPSLALSFTPTGGIYQGEYGTAGAITMGAIGAYDAGFGTDFDNTGDGVADINAVPEPPSAVPEPPSAVPEPSSVALLLTGTAAIFLARRKRSVVA